MAFPDELVQLAQELANIHPENPGQAALRRAVSTAYYALFHLLISEATLNWNRRELRSVIGRVFEHGKMKAASENKVSELTSYFKDNPPESPEQRVSIHLHWVANTFIQAQQQRNTADYNTEKEWTYNEALTQIESVNQVFKSWHIIRNESVAQAFLVSLLGSKERRQNDNERSARNKKKQKKNLIPPIPQAPST
jgi:hypothetical protein